MEEQQTIRNTTCHKDQQGMRLSADFKCSARLPSAYVDVGRSGHDACEWSTNSKNFFKNITNKMQRYTIFYITVNALHVSGGFSAHYQELKNCTHNIWYMSSLLAATASVGELSRLPRQPTLDVLTGCTSSRPMTCTSDCYYNF